MYTLNSDVIVKETRNTSYPWDMCAFGMICHFTKTAFYGVRQFVINQISLTLQIYFGRPR